MKTTFSCFMLAALLATACQNKPTQETTAAKPVHPDAPLRETRWVPRELAGQAVVLTDSAREPYLLLRAAGAAEGNGSCNRFRGNFFSEKPGELKFSPLMSTRMACPAIATENAFTQALAQANTYRISGDTLRLFDATNAPLARLEAVYLQ